VDQEQGLVMNCRLCDTALTPHNKCEAHILPKSIFKLIAGDEFGKQAMIVVGDSLKRKSRSWTGAYDEHILCEKCDKMIGKFDKTMIEFLTNEKPDVKQVVVRDKKIGWEVQDIKQSDVVIFLLSYLFRASITSHQEYSGVSLGNKYEGMIAKILCGGLSELLSFTTTCFCYEKILPGLSLAPTRIRAQGVNWYEIYMPGGYVFYVKVDNRCAPDVMRQYALGEREKLFVFNNGHIQDSKLYREAVRLVLEN
jgi:hypothetical protein